MTWEVITVCKWNFASLCHILKEIISSKNSTKSAAWKLVPGPFVFCKMIFLKQSSYIRYVGAKLSKLVQKAAVNSK